MRKKTILRLIVSVWAYAALAACSPVGHDYPETVARLIYMRAADEFRPIFWLDKDRVFIPGYAPDDSSNPKDGIFILDTRTNTYQRYTDLVGERSAWFCYFDGFISYPVLGSDGKFHQKEGKMGEEREVPDSEKQLDPSQRRSYSKCKKIDRAKRFRPEHRQLDQTRSPVRAVFLREEDGYIFLDHCREAYCAHIVREYYDQPAKLNRYDRKEPTDLPILVKEMSGSIVRYAAWAGKYIIASRARRDRPYESGEGMAGKEPLRIYLLSPDGSIEAIPLADGAWLPPGDAALTRAGIFLAANNATRANDGGWLVKADGRRQHLFSGVTIASGVSPDGCKLAYAAAASKDNLVHILDFCTRK